MKFLDTGEILEAPKIKGIPMLYCARYAILAAKILSDSKYVPANAWELGIKNKIVVEERDIDLKLNLVKNIHQSSEIC